MSWGEIKKALNSTLGNSDFKALDQLLGDDITAVQNALTNILQGGNVPIVKSVQRGINTSNSTSGTVTISTVNPEKSIVLIDATANSLTNDDGTCAVAGARSGELTSNSFTYAKGYMRKKQSYPYDDIYIYPSFSWQVIEFY